MGGGKRNYEAMRRNSQWGKLTESKKVEVKDEEKKQPPKKEDVKDLLSLWLNSKKKEDKKEPT